MTTHRVPRLADSSALGSVSDSAAVRALGIDLALLWLRVSFGLTLAFTHGLSKLQDPGHFLEVVAQRGFPAPSLLGWAAILSEVAGGIALALGLFTRTAGAFVAVTLFIAAFKVHAADPFAKKELALAYAAIGVAFVAAGAGRYSLDAWLAQKLLRRNDSDGSRGGRHH